MSFYRPRKQITVALIFFALIVLIGWGIYSLYNVPVPNCSDGIKNQDEIDVDCGGAICMSCEPRQAITVLWTKAISSGGGKYDLAAQIRNPNPNLGRAVFKYIFEFKNSEGRIIGQKNGTAFIMPNETKYIIDNNIKIDEPFSSLVLTIESGLDIDWRAPEIYPSDNLIVKDRKIEIASQANYFAEATGVVKNSTAYGFQKVYLDIVLFDGAKNLIGAAKTELSTLAAGEDRAFSVRWFGPLEGAVASYDMQASTNYFLKENYMRVYGTPEEQ